MPMNLQPNVWGEAEGLYFHRDHQGAQVPVKAVSGFMPLFAGIPDAARAARLAAHLRNPATFGAPALVPSESLDSGTFCKDMWRGPAWMNLSYLIVLGLRRYGLCADAEAIKENLLDTVGQWYARDGCLFEYYDSLGLTSPRALDRKQRLISGKGIAPICDYHRTAAVTAALLLR
jgi:neutral trehalase